jgi:hypothetical protein
VPERACKAGALYGINGIVGIVKRPPHGESACPVARGAVPIGSDGPHVGCTAIDGLRSPRLDTKQLGGRGEVHFEPNGVSRVHWLRKSCCDLQCQ